MSGWALEYSFEVDEKNAIIYAKVFGIWKADTARSYHDDFKTEVEPIVKQPWAKLVDLSNWRTSYPEVIDIIGEHMEWSRLNGVALSLYVLNNPSTFRQLHEMFTAGGTKEISMTFRTHAEAELYLKDNWFDKKKRVAAPK
ncbi:MAG: hypothetical protein WAU88_07480 [Candidatus Zixiibacteriota bacterium]